jgi:hypothetical protein
MTCVPWKPDLGCTTDEEWAAFPVEVQERAVELAWSALRVLTGGRVGNCPVLARPCRRGCGGVAWGASGPAFTPTLRDGLWFNNPCGCGRQSGCGCTEVSEVIFPGPVAAVYGVWLGGARLDPSAYRVDDGYRLVRQDGDTWPLCQNLTQPWDGDEAFSVVYLPGIRPGAAGLWAAGLLTVEFAKACTGGKCRLPSSVTSIARQGVSMDFAQGMFSGGVSGIREVDAWVKSVNPNNLTQPPRVWSPDVRVPRYQPIDFTLPPMPDGEPFGWEFAIDFDAVPAP